MIDGVLIKPLKVITNEKGDVRQMVRCDDPFFKNFGEIYFSFIEPGFVKGWKKHLRQTQHYAVPIGKIKLVLYDARTKSPTKGQVQEIIVGARNYQLVRIPPRVWYAFQAVGRTKALIANCADRPHEPKESINIEISDQSIPYTWKV
ncbi:MAG: dTDP-4-dehydrorhamnose 3,5-epimerase family protein [Candidatus Omnitrophica bacterium]|nr:dTDP-4-dehydrorhamnose 3,5-epimerase family protein [Candidatus Omnitrophota bacterium]